MRWPKSNSGATGFVESIQGFLCCGCGGASDDESEREKPAVRWLTLQAPGGGGMAFNDNDNESRGEVEVAMELLPAELAAKRPAGDGRSDPNQNPILAEPDRASLLSLANPLVVLRSLVGVKALKLLLCVSARNRCIQFCIRSSIRLDDHVC